MAAPRKCPLESREHAVRMYRTSDPKPVIRCMAEELGVHPVGGSAEQRVQAPGPTGRPRVSS